MAKEEECGEEGLDGTYGSPCNRRLRRRVRARGFQRSLCLCVSGVPEGASENEGSGRWMRSERKVVVCADGGAAGDGGWLVVVVVVVVVVEASEQAGGQAG